MIKEWERGIGGRRKAVIKGLRDTIMSKCFDETMQGLLEVIVINKEEVTMIEKENMLVPTFVAADTERKLID